MSNLVGSSYVTFLVALSIPLDEPVQVSYATEPGTGTPGTHYQHAEGVLTFAPGETQKNVQVLVYGLPEGSPTPRTFRLRLEPTPGAILESPITEATIYVGDPSVNGSYYVVVAQGPKGDKGDKGDPGTDGLPVELRVGETYIQWRYVGSVVWTNLVAVADITGPAGVDGVDGVDGTNGVDGKNFQPDATDLILNRSNYDAEPAGFSFLATDESLLYFRDGATGWSAGVAFGKGDDGRDVQLQATATEIQWRYAGDAAWTSLVLLSQLKGEQGIKGDTGNDGREVEFQKTATHIQWRFIGDAGWTNLVSLADITGPKGDIGLKGDKGDPGQSFTPNVIAPLAQRVNYDSEAPGFAFLASDQGSIYFRLDPTGWSDAVPFGKGDPGADGNTIHTVSAEPLAALGQDGDYAIDPTTQLIYGPKAAGAWPAGTSIKGEKGDPGDPSGAQLATTAEAKAATSSTVATTPAGVREYLEQFGLTSTYTDTAADLNTIVKGGLFNWGTTTANAPVAASYGRGICIPSGAGDVTQWSVENTTGKMHVRYQDGGTWGAWMEASGGNAREIELRKGATHIEWRYAGDVAWTALVALADITGPAGADGSGVPAGGTTGQLLAKASNADGDVEWIAPPAGGGGASNMVSAILAADTNNSEVTLQTKLEVTVEGGGLYVLRVRAMTRPNAKTMGIKVGLTGTAGISSGNVTTTYMTDVNVLSARTVRDKNAPVSFPTSEFDNTGSNLLKMDGVLFIASGGTLGLGIAANVQYEYWSLMKGSVMTLEKIGTLPL